jgi:hypothetical protein
MREFAVIMAVIAAVSAIAQCQPRRLVLKPTEPMPTVLITSCRSAKAILPKPSGGVLGYGMPLDEIIHSGPIEPATRNVRNRTRQSNLPWLAVPVALDKSSGNADMRNGR